LQGSAARRGLADRSARQQGVGPILSLGPTGPMVNVTAERQWLTIAACPLRPWGPSGTWVAEVDRQPRVPRAYHATNTSPDRRRLVMGEMTQDAF
jgi:hypothetical protein